MLAPIISEIYSFPESCGVSIIALVWQMRTLRKPGSQRVKRCNPDCLIQKLVGLKPATTGIRKSHTGRRNHYKTTIKFIECLCFFPKVS